MVDKVGRTTGWTWGLVKKTCTDGWVGGPFGGYKFVCQQEATYTDQGGDSGSPVFTYLGGSTALLLGIHWGGSGSNSIYSPLENVELDFGPLDPVFAN